MEKLELTRLQGNAVVTVDDAPTEDQDFFFDLHGWDPVDEDEDNPPNDPSDDLGQEIIEVGEGVVPDICLVAIMKDESSLVARWLESTKNLVDRFLVCDTGSSDDTVERLEAKGRELGIPGRVMRHPWKDFGHNKSWLFRAAHDWGLANKARYLIWLDADEVLIRGGEEHPPRNEAEAYPTTRDRIKLLQWLDSRPDSIVHLGTNYGPLRYIRTTIARNDRPYRWHQPVHEVLVPLPHPTCPGKAAIVGNYDGLVVWARKQGNSARNPGRGRMDIRKFNGYLRRHPDDPRATFYLGQTLYEHAKTADREVCFQKDPTRKKKWQERTAELRAVGEKVLKKRLKLKGWSQEKYVALLMLGRMLVPLDERKPDVESWWLQAALQFPSRREALWEWLSLLGKTQRFSEGYSVARYCLSVQAATREQTLFLEEEICKWRVFMEAGVFAYYTGNYHDALVWGKTALEEGPKSGPSADTMKTNMQFFRKAVSRDALRTLDSSSATQSCHLKSPTESLDDWFPVLPEPVPTKPPPVPTALVVDNFYSDPLAVRAFALRQEFGVKGNYPGSRTKAFATQAQKRFFEKLMGRKISYWPEGPESYNGSFQLATSGMKSWIHRDLTQYGAVVFLTPNAPFESGTDFYAHKATGATKAPLNSDLDKRLSLDSQNMEAWNKVDSLGNKFNRLIVFDGFQSHMSGPYFGETPQDARLFQVYFFSLE